MNDKNKKTKELFVLISVSILLGLILSIQFKTVNKSVGEGVLPTQRAQQLASDLKRAQSEREEYIDQITELEEKIDQFEKGEVDKNEYAESLYEDILKYRMLAGYMDLEGEGIVLEIDEPTEDIQYGEEYSIVDELDLILQIISILNAADAEAISINDQRYTTYSEIIRVGNHIEINGVSTNTPLIIKAIGNPDTLESALMIKGGIIWEIRRYDYVVHINQDKNISIPKYRKVKEFKYAVPVED